jgi:hypothetical protein
MNTEELQAFLARSARVYELLTSWLFQAFDDGEHKRSKEQNLRADSRAEMILLTSWASSRRQE